MLFESKTNALKIQITDEGQVQALAFGRAIWSLPLASISAVAAKDIAFNTCKKVTLYTDAGRPREIASMPNKDYDLFLTFLPEGTVPNAGQRGKEQGDHDMNKAIPKVVQRGKKQWYHDMNRMTHIATYTSQKEAAKEMEEAAKFGWVPQTSAAQNGKFSVGKALVGGVLLPGVGLLAGAVGNKDKLTITYLRSK